MLWHDAEPIGIALFAAPAASLSLRSRYFGLRAARSGLAMRSLNDQLWVLARVVLHPTWRGAGIAAAFVDRACSLCPVPWIETLTAMGHVHPVFEHAGFERVGVIRKRSQGNGAYARRRPGQAGPSFSEPVYYLRANAPAARSRSTGQNLTCPSRPAVTTFCPSGDTAMSLMPERCQEKLARGARSDIA